MEWKKLLTQTRLMEEEPEAGEFDQYPISPFEKDYEKIVSSAAFRRLQDKTQVFPLSKSDFVRTRLTHSVEVSTIAKQMGIMCFRNTNLDRQIPLADAGEKNQEVRAERIGHIEAILSCAGLLHDIGNPPFGHVGEEIIREWFRDNLKNIRLSGNEDGKSAADILDKRQVKDLENFEGNAQAFRILSKARYQSEINLPFSIISALIKYPTSSEEIGEPLIRHKMGYFQAEESIFMQIAKEAGTINEQGKVVRHPLAYLVEAADDIAYMTADLEDAVQSGLVSVEELLNFFNEEFQQLEKKCNGAVSYTSKPEMSIKKLADLNGEETDKTKVMSQWGTYLRRWLMYVACWKFNDQKKEILQGEFRKDLFQDTFHRETVKMLKGAMQKFVFDAQVITEPEISAQTILNFLLDRFVPAVVRQDYPDLLTTQDKKVFTLIPQNYIDDYKRSIETDGVTDEASRVYRRILIATDFISGMTDGYAKTLYRKMSGLE